MVLPKFFKPSSPKKKNNKHDNNNGSSTTRFNVSDEDDGVGTDHSYRTTTPSPTKRSSPKRTSHDREREREREVRPRLQPTKLSRSRNHKASSGRSNHDTDPNTHPLNLPPEQLRKRLSAMSARNDSQTSVDFDREGIPTRLPSMVSNSSPPPVGPGAHLPNTGVNGGGGPVPPPHQTPLKRTPAPPPPPPPQSAPPTISVEGESFKAAGNKYFKAKEYAKAVKEYTRGEFSVWGRAHLGSLIILLAVSD